MYTRVQLPTRQPKTGKNPPSLCTLPPQITRLRKSAQVLRLCISLHPNQARTTDPSASPVLFLAFELFNYVTVLCFPLSSYPCQVDNTTAASYLPYRIYDIFHIFHFRHLHDIFHPPRQALERLSVGNVVHHHKPLSSLEKARCQRVEPLLTRSVPDLRESTRESRRGDGPTSSRRSAEMIPSPSRAVSVTTND